MIVVGASAADATVPPALVWATLLDGLRWSEWSGDVEWMVVEGRLAPGAYVTLKRRRKRQTAFRVEAAEPERRLVLLLTFGPLASMRLTWTLQPAPGGTAITLTVASGGLLQRLLTDGLARDMAAALAADPDGLARAAEARSPA